MVKNISTAVVGLVGISFLGYMFMEENEKSKEQRELEKEGVRLVWEPRTRFNYPTENSDTDSEDGIQAEQHQRPESTNLTELILRDDTAERALNDMKSRLGYTNITANDIGLYDTIQPNSYCKSKVDFGDKKYYFWRRGFIFQQIYAKTPNKYAVCVPFKVASSMFWHGIGELYNGSKDKEQFKKNNLPKMIRKGTTHKLNAAYMQNRFRSVENLSFQVNTSKKRILVTRHPIERLISFWDNKFKRLFGSDLTKREDVMGYYAGFMMTVFNITEKSCLPKGINPLKFDFAHTGAHNTWGDAANEHYHVSFRQVTWFILVVDNIMRNGIEHCAVNFDSMRNKGNRLAWQYFYMHIGPQFEQCRVCELEYHYKVNLRHLKEDFLPIYGENHEFAFLYEKLKGNDSAAIMNKGTGQNISDKSKDEKNGLIKKYLAELETKERELILDFFKHDFVLYDFETSTNK